MQSIQFSSKTDGLGKIFTAVLCNKVHYARYGTYYIQHLRQLEKSHPVPLHEIRSFMSTRRNETGIEQAIDFAGEQTYMRNTKTTVILIFD